MSTEFAEPIVASGYDSASVTRKITDLVLTRPVHRSWIAGFSIAFALLMLFLFAIAWLLIKGVGIWGVNIPVAWGFAITNFVWWIGIGHAGTFISAILLLLHQDWRTSINRFAEAMTLFAVACAGTFPLLHLGRPWVFYWLLPYPDTMNLWPQWRSALVWDVFAVATYLTVSLIFWYVGLIPDLATMRDRAKNKFAQISYGIFALGWRGSARHWKRFHVLYLLLAGLATPLVLSVHSIVSTDFSIAIVPGWHSTIFPPYFVAGAIFSGFAMVLTLAIPIRKFYHLEDFITLKHLENSAKVMLATGLMVAHGYITEAFMSWYSEDKFEIYMTLNRMFGPYAPAYWLLVACNVIVPQALWFKRLRTSVAALFIISILVNVGMWTERYVIVITSLHRDFTPAAWGMFHGTRWDWMTLLGSFGLFATLFFLFLRVLPAISISEMRYLVHKKSEGRG
ncbi:MAG TPA: NrfD/PsrC family molybdoenzyme membrane anchor subunit [Chthoniobacterales bacterium]|nr:NrfD/PsrC family molybdoenzyme membrane anchor subunit [Chthoniobacterales bacterium]